MFYNRVSKKKSVQNPLALVSFKRTTNPLLVKFILKEDHWAFGCNNWLNQKTGKFFFLSLKKNEDSILIELVFCGEIWFWSTASACSWGSLISLIFHLWAIILLLKNARNRENLCKRAILRSLKALSKWEMFGDQTLFVTKHIDPVLRSNKFDHLPNEQIVLQCMIKCLTSFK